MTTRSRRSQRAFSAALARVGEETQRRSNERFGVVVLGADGRVHHASSGAKSLLSGLSFEGIEALAASAAELAGEKEGARELVLSTSEGSIEARLSRLELLERAIVIELEREVAPAVDHLEVVAARSGWTRREKEVAALAARGLGNREIGLELRIAADTVKVHLGRAYRKAGIRSRTELASLLHGGAYGPL